MKWTGIETSQQPQQTDKIQISKAFLGQNRANTYIHKIRIQYTAEIESTHACAHVYECIILFI